MVQCLRVLDHGASQKTESSTRNYACGGHRGKMSAHAPLRTHLIHLIFELLSSLCLSLFGGEGKVLLDLLMIKISRST